MKKLITIFIVLALMYGTAWACTTQRQRELSHLQMMIYETEEILDNASPNIKEWVEHSLWNMMRLEHYMWMDYYNTMERFDNNEVKCEIYMRNILNY